MLQNATRGLAIAVLGIGLALGCGGDREQKMDRGLTVDDEMAAPGTPQEFDMTEAERRAKLEAGERKQEAEEFDEAAEP